MVINNLVKQVIKHGGSIHPLVITTNETNGTGLMNPTIMLDKGKLIVNIRHVNYTLYHCENDQLFNNRWGPLVYLNPENDMHLRTTNWYCELNDDLSISRFNKIDTSKLDVEPLWEFVGLEDGRFVRWDNKLYLCGVRRDTTTNGMGRMELSEIKVKSDSVQEITRSRIEHPYDPNWYCEKNWMPIMDMPFHFMKWTNATEIVKVDPVKGTSEIVIHKQQVGPHGYMRGGSQIIPYKNKYICITHECNMKWNKLNQKDAQYTHRIVVWDRDWNIEHVSDSFSFMAGEIEFCTGIVEYNNDLLITFGFQDNAAYLLKMPQSFFDQFVNLDDKWKSFDWGILNDNEWFLDVLKTEFKDNTVYQKYFNVEKDDVVLDVGASVGPFTYSILDKKPKKVYCFEPHTELFKSLQQNVESDKVVCINKGIMDTDGLTKFRGLYDPTVNLTWEKENELDGISFKTFIQEHNIKHIDFLKLDCEGAEYYILTPDNLEWIKNNVRKIVGEFHLSNDYLKTKFIEFRDTYLTQFDNYRIEAHDGTDIKWDLFNDHFTEYYSEINVYVDNTKPKKEYWKTTEHPTLEFTTSIPKKGCVVDCAFCPQRTLIKTYSADKLMSLEQFKEVIDKLPKEIRITFSGFTEPFLNKQCADMILYAHEQGHRISVFTTGVGMSIDDLDRIKHIPFDQGPNGGFCLHLPDEEEIAKHPITKQYIKLIEHFKIIEHEIQGFYTMCMGPVHNSITHIYPESHIPEFWSRAGNLLVEAEIKPELKKIEDRFKHMDHGDEPKTCGCIEDLYHNVVLPNGDVSLCCMDYNLNHIIGNIYEQDYDDIIPAPNTSFSLCQTCENGINPK